MNRLRSALSWLVHALFWLISLPFRLIFRFLAWLFSPVGERLKRGKIYQFLTDVPEDHPVADVLVNAFDNPEEILNELDVIRHHLVRALLVLALAVGLSFVFTQNLIAWLAVPVGGLQHLQAIEVTEQIGVFMRVALIAGIAIASPYIAFEFWLYIAPGLMPSARRVGLFGIPLAAIFFLGGMAFAYYIMLPAALPFLLDFLGIATRLRPASYFSFVTGVMFWIGVAFEFPLVIFALSAMGLVQPSLLLKQWRIAVVIIAILAAAITPTIDPVNMSLVMGPMIALYFLSILFSYVAQSTRPKS